MFLPKELREQCIVVKLPFDVLDARQAPHVRQALNAVKKDQPRVVMNLEKVNFLDSTGLGVILTLLREFKEDGCELRLSNAASPVRDVFRVVHLEEMFPLYETADDAASAAWLV